MAKLSKISIATIQVGATIHQVKTGDIYTVVSVDTSSNKAIIESESGEQKSISRATLERWYKVDEEASISEPTESEQDTDAEEQDIPEEQEEHIEDKPNSEETTDEADDKVESNSKGTNTSEADTNDNSGEYADTRTGNINSSSGDEGDGEEIKAPIAPSNASTDKDAQKRKSEEQKAEKNREANAALQKVRQQIIDTIIAEGNGAVVARKTSSYTALREKCNFAEITNGLKVFNVSVISKCLTEDQISKVKIAPASFGWSIDADFTVFDEGDIPFALQLIRQSRQYRLLNPVTRTRRGENK